MGNFGSRLRHALGALLLLGFALGAWAGTITLNGGADGSVTCAATSDIAVSTTGNVTANVTAGTTLCTFGATPPPPPGTFTLTVNTNGTGTGTVNCNSGIGCLSSYTGGTQMTFVAQGTNGSTFTSWGGECSGTTSATCYLTTSPGDTNHTVTATFTAPVSGSDPGTGVWPNGNNYVHDRGGLSELYVPRCVPSQYTNCQYGGRSSLYDTMVAGQVWSMRIPTASTGFAATTYGFAVQRAETGETLTGFDYAISATVGDFNVTSGCKGSGAGSIKVYGVGYYTPSLYSPSCPLTPGTRYYLNVRPQTGSAGATQCGSNATNACRYRIVLPSGFPYSQ